MVILLSQCGHNEVTVISFTEQSHCHGLRQLLLGLYTGSENLPVL